MTSTGNSNYIQLSIDQPALYRIRIKGELEESWSDRMAGMQIRRQTEEDGSIMSTLEGHLIDQAALFGVLVALYNMRLPLISVECLDINRKDDKPLVKVKVEQKTDFLEFIVTGREEALQGSEPLDAIFNSCKLARLYRVLVDFRGLERGKEENPSVEYVHEVGHRYQELLAEGWTPLKAAVVGKEDIIEDWRQNEKITQEYGMEVFITSDYEKAVAWLGNE